MPLARSRSPPPRRSEIRGEDRSGDGESYELENWSEHGDGDSAIIYRNEAATELTPADLDDDAADVSSLPPRRKRGRAPSFTLYTPDEERAVMRRLDRRLVLFVALLYLLSFLDRSNIGNARIAGMTTDLRLNSAQYEALLTAFYTTYVLFEWMTLLYSVLPPHRYIALCVASWGLVASLQSVATSFGVMLVLRAALGIAEAAFGPGVPFYLSFFFRREELAFRTGLFISAAPLATSFASSLAWGITHLARTGPFATWRLLFLIEGFPSMFVAVFAWLHLPDSPETARFLTSRQRKVAALRLRDERKHQRGHGGTKRRLAWKEIGKTLMDPKAYLTALMFFSANVAFSSLPPFLPTIINEMNYSALASQALSAPPYLVSFGLVLLVAFMSDRHRSRSSFVILSALTGATGYAFLAVSGALGFPSWLRYLAVYPAAAGFFCAITLIITWTLNNQASTEGKGTGVAMLNVIGQLGPLVGTRLYPDSDKPYYVMGMAVCACFMLAVAGLAMGLRVVLRKANSRAAMEVNYARIGEAQSDIPLDDGEGDEAPRKPQFVYML